MTAPTVSGSCQAQAADEAEQVKAGIRMGFEGVNVHGFPQGSAMTIESEYITMIKVVEAH